jgi:hypothetical protein
MEFRSLREYEKDIKGLLKKYRTLSRDLEDVRKVLAILPHARPPFSYRIDGLGIKTCVIKVRKIASDSFKGKGANSGFRLVYAHFENEERVVFVELYHKNEKECEDRERIKKNFK